jgi:hypothetical protein
MNTSILTQVCRQAYAAQRTSRKAGQVVPSLTKIIFRSTSTPTLLSTLHICAIISEI